MTKSSYGGPLATAMLLVAFVAPVACGIDLRSDDLDGRPCKAGACLTGFTCDVRTNTCRSAGAIEETGGVSSVGGNFGSGGVAEGGSGLVASGGRSTGGSGAGGTSAGGANATGGVATGGVATGGVATGGVATGGVATGGVATGGVATGGVATGGVATGGAISAGGAELVCRGQTCGAGESCCTTSFPGYPTLPPASAFSCTKDTSSCAFALHCDDDGDCPSDELCCASRGASGWTAACVKTCLSPAIHVGCTLPEHCPSGVCCGEWSAQTNGYTRVACTATCTGFTAYTFCASNADCGRLTCAESTSLPGYRICQ